MNGRWVCSDVWFDTFPFFDRPQLGLKLALLSPRFNLLVDKHFDCKRELTIWRTTMICKDSGQSWSLLDLNWSSKLLDFQNNTAAPKLSVLNDYANFVPFPLPNHSLHNKIRFKSLLINYIDHSVIAFLRANQQIWDKGTNLCLSVPLARDDRPIWDVLVRQLWPIFAPNIRHLILAGGDELDDLRLHISPTFLTDFDHLDSISRALFPDGIADDGPNATSRQALSKWLHTPSKNGQPKRLFCKNCYKEEKFNWVNNFKETFIRATASVSYKIRFKDLMPITPIEPFEFVNERTNEKLTLEKAGWIYWQLKRCQIGTPTEVQSDDDENWDDNLNNVKCDYWCGINCIGPSSPPTEEEADQSNGN